MDSCRYEPLFDDRHVTVARNRNNGYNAECAKKIYNGVVMLWKDPENELNITDFEYMAWCPESL
jgi:hypothetical protein